ncbi:MAG: hypothetical protein MJK14_25075, partial [Rivularia sp. ALOHA_DT_140]|nr:hypothetical protein [Rivularia sp. ALOHA_DT_140]
MSKKILTRRKFLFSLAALTAMGAVVTGKEELKRQQILALDDPNCECLKYPGGESLKERAAKKNILFGAAIRYGQLKGDE